MKNITLQPCFPQTGGSCITSLSRRKQTGERIGPGVQALAGHQTITGLAGQAGVSRKFVYQQADIAQAALDDAFTPTVADDQVLFHLPITKNWLKQAALGLTLICHSSYRGVSMAVGTVHNIVHDAIDKARPHNLAQNLANVKIAGQSAVDVLDDTACLAWPASGRRGCRCRNRRCSSFVFSYFRSFVIRILNLRKIKSARRARILEVGDTNCEDGKFPAGVFPCPCVPY